MAKKKNKKIKKVSKTKEKESARENSKLKTGK